jgi:phasin
MADIPRFEVPPQMRALAETSIGQARTAFDGLMGLAKRGAETMRSASGPATPGADVFDRGLGYTEQNVHAALDHAQKLARASSLQEAMQLQAEYMRTQFAVMQEQAKEFGGMAQGAMQQSAEQAKAAMQRGADEARRMTEQGQDAARDAMRTAQDAVDRSTS